MAGTAVRSSVTTPTTATEDRPRSPPVDHAPMRHLLVEHSRHAAGHVAGGGTSDGHHRVGRDPAVRPLAALRRPRGRPRRGGQRLRAGPAPVRAARVPAARRADGRRRDRAAALARRGRDPGRQPVRRAGRCAPRDDHRGHLAAARRGREHAGRDARPQGRGGHLRRPVHRGRRGERRLRAAAAAAAGHRDRGRRRDGHRAGADPDARVARVVRRAGARRALAGRHRRLPPAPVQPRDLRARPALARLRLEPPALAAGRRRDPVDLGAGLRARRTTRSGPARAARRTSASRSAVVRRRSGW